MDTAKHIVESRLLALRYQRGDAAALERLVALWQRPLFFFIRRMTATEADAWDVLQEVWVRVLRHLGKLRDVQCVVPWLYKVARNAAMSHRSHLPREEALTEETADAVADDANGVCFPADEAEAIRVALDKLPLPQREVLSLFFLEEFSLMEIAAIVEAPEGTVKSRLFYGKKALYEVLKKEMGHDR